MPLHYTNIYTTLKAGSSGDIAVLAPVGGVDVTGNGTVTITSTVDDLNLVAGANVNVNPTARISMFGSTGLDTASRPTIDPTMITDPDLQALVVACIALGVVIDGT